MENSFVHLHVHSEYSLLNSVARIDSLVRRAKELHMPALAITDQGTMSGVIPFYKACKREGIKPIIGCEFGIVSNQRFGKELDSMVLIAETTEGYHNLMSLVTASQLTKNQTPSLDKAELSRYSPGLIALGSDKYREANHASLTHYRGNILDAFEEYIDIFGRDHFFIELSYSQKPDQEKINRQLLLRGNQLGVGVVATNTVRYVEKGDLEAYQCISCIRTGGKWSDKDIMNLGDQNDLKSAEAMTSAFSYASEAIFNTVKIADRCDVDISFGERKFPVFSIAKGMTAQSFLRERCDEGAAVRYATVGEEVRARLNYELAVIHQMNLDDYFLVVWDFVKYAREQHIAVGPGRGSAAGSLVCYVLGITNIDPLRYQLLFERFLNPERISLPDIDLDFSDERREEMIYYAKEKYGVDHVAQIVTFGTLSPRAAIRDIGRVLDIPVSQVDEIARHVPPGAQDFDELIQRCDTLRSMASENGEIDTLFRMVRKVEGLPRHTSTHAAGIVISGIPLTQAVPLQQGSLDIALTQYPMEVLEEIGLLKIDFLGLRNLSVIERTKALINPEDHSWMLHSMEGYQDGATYALISSGNTMGVFQMESSGMKRVLQQAKPTIFEDLVAILALYRPGPMDQIPRFIQAKQGLEEVQYPHPDLESILSSTYGVIVYQEQIIQIASRMAGFSLSEADQLRRAVSKKRHDLLMGQRSAFIQGCMSRGYGEEVGEQIYGVIVRFANYGFPRSHSAAYAVLAYETAFLKANFPLPFMTALLTTVMDNQVKLGEYLEEVRQMGILILPPDVNESMYEFSIENGALRFGLGAIKYIGAYAIRSILSAREKGLFQDIADFGRRVDLRICNRKVVETLIQCGAMDCFSGHRAEKIALLDDVFADQIQLFDQQIQAKADISMYTIDQKLAHEMELLGVYVSGHPLDQYEKAPYTRSISELKREEHLQHDVTIFGMVTRAKVIMTKKGEKMAFCTIQDQHDQIEVVFFPNTYTLFGDILQEAGIVMVKGKIERSGRECKLIAVQAKPGVKKQKKRIYIRIPADKEKNLYALQRILFSHSGAVPVYLFYERTKKVVSLPVEKYGIIYSEQFANGVNLLFGEDVIYIKEIE